MSDHIAVESLTFDEAFQLGQDAFERGKYRESLTFLAAALDQVLPNSQLGGEVQLWMVNAHQAAGESDAAIVRCEQLAKHPFPQISKTARDLLYILKAPVLNRPKEWLSEIPDLANLEDSERRDRYIQAQAQKESGAIAPEDSEPVLTEPQENPFILIVLGVLLLILIGVAIG